MTAAFCLLAAAVALLLTWKIPINSFHVQEKARNLLGELISAHYISWAPFLSFGVAMFCSGPRLLSFIADSNYIERIKTQFKAGEGQTAQHGCGSLNACLTLPAWVSVQVSADQKCRLPRVCAPDHFAMRLTSGADNMVGPQICFEGKTCVTDAQRNLHEGRMAKQNRT